MRPVSRKAKDAATAAIRERIPGPQTIQQTSTGGRNRGVFIAEVDSNATGGGYYNCHLQTLDATDWNTTTADQLDDTGDSVVVLNLAEIGGSNHALSVGDTIICWNFTDDEGTVRLVGIGWTKISIQTDFQVDGSNSELEKKTRANVVVLGADAEVGWTVVHTGTVC